MQRYLRHLIEERRLAPASVRLASQGLRFFYRITLDRPNVETTIPLPKGAKRLPEILSPTIVVYGPCVGDCDDNGMVAINELIGGVNISIGAQSLTLYPVFDPNRSGFTEINELIQAVNNALDASGNICPRRVTAPIGS